MYVSQPLYSVGHIFANMIDTPFGSHTTTFTFLYSYSLVTAYHVSSFHISFVSINIDTAGEV